MPPPLLFLFQLSDFLQSNQLVIPSSSPYTGKDTTAAVSAASIYHQHAPPQYQYNGLQIVPQSPYSIPASGQVRTNQKSKKKF